MLCKECRAVLGPGELACSNCGDIPEEWAFLRWVLIGFGIALPLHFVLGRLGIAGKGLLRETIMTGSFLMMLGYTVMKIVQKLRDSGRPVFDEGVAVFSDRFGRILLVILTVGAAWYAIPALYLTFTGVGFPPAPREPEWFTRYREVRGFFGCLVCLLGVAAVLRQGPRFFDPRVRSTYEGRRVGRGVSSRA